MRLLRALLRCASPGSIPQQVDFYSRFSPSPLSMKQFLDFGEYPPPQSPVTDPPGPHPPPRGTAGREAAPPRQRPYVRMSVPLCL